MRTTPAPDQPTAIAPAFDPGPAPQLAWLPVERLIVDPAYQRTIDTDSSRRLIAKIAANFAWAAFQAVLTTPEGNGWKLIDGQHRVEAAKSLGISLVPAVIIATADQAAQAAAFIRANGNRKAVDAFSMHRAALVAGEEQAVAIEALVRGVGLRIPISHPNSKSLKIGEVLSVSLFSTLRARYPAEAVDACGAVADAYRSELGGLRAPFFTAAAMLIKVGRADRAALTWAFRQSTAAALFDKAVIGNSGQSGRAVAVAAVLTARLARRPAAQVVESVPVPARPKPSPPPPIDTPAPAKPAPPLAPPLKAGQLPPPKSAPPAWVGSSRETKAQPNQPVDAGRKQEVRAATAEIDRQATPASPPTKPAVEADMPLWRKARLELRRAGFEVKQFDGDLLLDGQHTSDEALIELARAEGLIA